MNLAPPGILSLLVIFAAAPAPAQDLPAKPATEDMAGDATKLLDDLPALTDPGDTADGGPVISVKQAKTRLEQAQKKMQRWEKLFKDGVLSRAEVERSTVAVAEALARYEHANVAEIQRQLAEEKQRVAGGATDQGLIASATESLKSAQAAAAKAEAQLLQTKYDLAKINVERQRKLYEMKLISKAGLIEAEALVQKFADLKALQEAAPEGALTAKDAKAPAAK